MSTASIAGPATQARGSSAPGQEPRFATLDQAALAASQAAALACYTHLAPANSVDVHDEAKRAVRSVLARAPGRGMMTAAELPRDGSSVTCNGERAEPGQGARFDVALGLPSAGQVPGLRSRSLASIALAEDGTLRAVDVDPHAQKVLVGPNARGAVDVRCPIEENLRRVAHALGRPVVGLRVAVLADPMQAMLVDRLVALGVHVHSITGGEISGALAVLLPDGGADVMLGTGSSAEDVLIACAARAIGGDMQLSVRSREVGDPTTVLTAEHLVSGQALFATTAVANGTLLNRPRQAYGYTQTESLLLVGETIRKVIEPHRDV